MGEDSDRVFRNQAFYLTNTGVHLNSRVRLMTVTRFDDMQQGQDSLRLIQTNEGEIVNRDIQQKARKSKELRSTGALTSWPPTFFGEKTVKRVHK